MSIKKLIITCLIIFSLSFCLILSVSAYSHAHKGLKNVPSTIYLSSSLSSPAQARCKDAMATWNEGCFSYDCLVYGGITGVTSSGVEDDTNTITFTETGDTYLGIAFITQKDYTFLWLNWYVVEFDININPTFDWYTNISETSITLATYDGYYDLETTVLHELGHVLGLAHTEEQYYNGQPIVMYPYQAREAIIRALSEDDRRGIVDLY